jgi:Icc-related predicted phosphoesterase
MRLLAFSDLHADVDRTRRLVELSSSADVVVGVGDFATFHSGLEATIDALSAIESPAVLVPGNNETEEALRDACDDWPAAVVLHGEAADIGGLSFFGLGAGVPVTPWDWSFDLTEDAAAAKLASCPEGCVLAVHSPPRGHVDLSSAGDHLGSEAVLRAIEVRCPRIALCGHIHEQWGRESRVGTTPVLNLGADGRFVDLD